MSRYLPGLSAPAEDAVAITPSDSAVLAQTTRAVYVGTGGDLKVVMFGGETVAFKSVNGGSVLPIMVTKVLSAGTTATDIVGVW